MQRLIISLVMDLEPSAPDGPGWYVQAWIDGKSVIPPVPVSAESAYEASRAIQEALQSTDGELPSVQIPTLAESGSKLIRQALEHALQEAEEAAARIKPLRRKLANIPEHA